MRWIKRIVIAVVALVALGLAGVYLSGNGNIVRLVWDFNFAAPDHPFDPADAVAPPDYAQEENWGALPQRADLGDVYPPGVELEVAQGEAPVDVFYVHPTGFLKGSSWTFSMDPDTSTEENTKWMIANQAAAFNSCCNVYAPRYRQASIFTYFAVDEAERERILAFAYEDVARAFDYFLEHYNGDRPFILASHSQGTHHGIRLLREKIDGTPLAEKLVAAYLIGGGLEQAEFEGLERIKLCDSERQVGCAVHWDTFSVAEIDKAEETGIVCTNPLSWKLEGGLAGREQHVGAVPTAGEYHLELSGDDRARRVPFDDMGEPIPNHLEAQCKGGRLYVTDQSDNAFGERGGFGGTYHGLDYALFYMDIRQNARDRAASYLLYSMGGHGH